MVRHPAKYSAALLAQMAEWLEGYSPVLDPMAGVGTLASIVPDAWLNEIEPEWAEQCLSWPQARVSTYDARDMRGIVSGSVGAICTSPTYGNRLADHHEATERCRACSGPGTEHFMSEPPCSKCGGLGRRQYTRNTYRHALGRPLDPANTGQMQWGERYREAHVDIWTECRRVLRPGGRLVLNISNHIRAGREVDVTRWHAKTLEILGFELVEHVHVATPRNRYGANGRARVDHESLLLFTAPERKEVGE